jgi:hypothetical protein
MVNPIASNRDIMGVEELDSIIAVPYFKSLNRDPADWIFRRARSAKKNPMELSLVDTFNDWELTRLVEELDGS